MPNMLQMKNKRVDKFNKIIALTLSIMCLMIFVFVFVTAMVYSVDCYATLRIPIFSLVGVGLLALSYTVMALFKNRRLLKFCIFSFFVCFVFFTLFLNLTCRNNPYSIIDYGFVVDAAVEYSEIGEQFDSSYFSNFTVNAFLMLVLSGIIRFCRFINVYDYYDFGDIYPRDCTRYFLAAKK